MKQTEAGLSHDEKVDNAIRFLGALVKPEHAWLVRSLKTEIARLRRLVQEA